MPLKRHPVTLDPCLQLMVFSLPSPVLFSFRTTSISMIVLGLRLMLELSELTDNSATHLITPTGPKTASLFRVNFHPELFLNA